MTNQLVDKTAIVLGASRGYGRGIALALAGTGMNVVAIARGERDFAALAAASPRIHPVIGDITDPVLAAKLVARERPHLVAIVGGANPVTRPLAQHTWDTYAQTWNVDVKATFTWTREALLLPLARGSTIVICSSAAALRGSAISGNYAAAKAAQWRMAHAIAQEAEPLGIAVRCILPGLTTETELGRDAIAAFARAANTSEADWLARRGHDPMVPSHVGDAVVHIANDRDAKALGYHVTSRGASPIDERSAP